MKNRNRFNFKEASNYLALYLLSLLFILNFSCKRTVYNAETRQIPKVMILTTNINDVAPEVSISITTEFESLPSNWYCRHYGSGDGTKPWYKEDTLAISNKNGPILATAGNWAFAQAKNRQRAE